ncbi:hypothetical protein PR202_gb16848 [Eleusine coracana subsp. coracana]|uniref:Uncharacterized protein n=1 Tax=Eleusine coracana subsp. coracana TaxID=191504 RepID=A0AAV5F1G2_ELECO|nr:hypothetical protein PR202_gb16848 [Eleusine coracana subsp. coracana]
MRATSRQTAVPRHRSSNKRSSPASHHHPTCWAILNETCVRSNDSDDRDRTMAVTSTGERIGVSFDLKERPRTSFLTVYLPDRLITSPTMELILSDVKVIAAHRDVVLFEMNPQAMLGSDRIDYFVFKASSGGGGDPSLAVTRALL